MSSARSHSMTRLLTLALLALAWMAPSFAAPIERIGLYVGEVRVLVLPAVERVAVGNPELLSSTVLDTGQLVLLGQAAGDTTLHLWLEGGAERRFAVHVRTGDPERISDQLRDLLSGVRGLEIRTLGEYIVLDGIVAPGDKKRVDTLAEMFPEQVRSLVQARNVDMRKMINLSVRIIEFDKSAQEQLGVRWDAHIAGPVAALRRGNLPAPAGEKTGDMKLTDLPPPKSFFGIASVLGSRIDLLVREGKATVLATPNLSTRSGGVASFLAGGQVPLPVIDTQGQTSVTFKDYGIRLSIKPVVDEDDNVQAEVLTEVSMIDDTLKVLDIPAFLTRQTSTDINLRSGETMVISGLINAQASRHIDKLPLLGDLPVLGALFRSSDFRNARSELVILVTPEVVNADSQVEAVGLARAAEAERLYREILDYNLLD